MGSFAKVLVAGWLVVGCAEVAGGELEATEALEQGQKIDCSYVKCAVPLCADGQHLVQNQGSCCPTCVGVPSRCAAVLCAAVVCPEGEQLVTSPGNCCGTCRKVSDAIECRTDEDCPVYNCIACPCPVSTCQGSQCITTTPDASTCGGDTL